MDQIVLNDLYDYDMKIYQDEKYFKFSIDSILLAEFVKLRKGNRYLLDLCSGNAPIPMILSKKYSEKIIIDAYELQPEIYSLGQKSIEYNNLNNINYYNDDIKNIAGNNKYDIVTCNPPYFINNGTNLVNDNEILAIARHEIKIKLEEVIAISARSLKVGGYFYMVHSSTRLAEIIIKLKQYKFGIKRIVFVYDNRNTKSSLVLIEAMKDGKDYVNVEKAIYIDEHKTYQNIFGGVK